MNVISGVFLLYLNSIQERSFLNPQLMKLRVESPFGCLWAWEGEFEGNNWHISVVSITDKYWILPFIAK